jgi:hypothetical protein
MRCQLLSLLASLVLKYVHSVVFSTIAPEVVKILEYDVKQIIVQQFSSSIRTFKDLQARTSQTRLLVLSEIWCSSARHIQIEALPTLVKSSPYAMPICIECRYPVKTLYTEYSGADDRSSGHGVRLTVCKNCGRFCDKYVEHDFVVLFIDLVLIKPQVCRALKCKKALLSTSGL